MTLYSVDDGQSAQLAEWREKKVFRLIKKKKSASLLDLICFGLLSLYSLTINVNLSIYLSIIYIYFQIFTLKSFLWLHEPLLRNRLHLTPNCLRHIYSSSCRWAGSRPRTWRRARSEEEPSATVQRSGGLRPHRKCRTKTPRILWETTRGAPGRR